MKLHRSLAHARYVDYICLYSEFFLFNLELYFDLLDGDRKKRKGNLNSQFAVRIARDQRERDEPSHPDRRGIAECDAAISAAIFRAASSGECVTRRAFSRRRKRHWRIGERGSRYATY